MREQKVLKKGERREESELGEQERKGDGGKVCMKVSKRGRDVESPSKLG